MGFMAAVRGGNGIAGRAQHFTLPAGLLCLAVAPGAVVAAEVGLAGVFPGKALLTIDGGPPRIVPVGALTPEGVKVLGVDGETATLEVGGRRRVLRVGQNVAAQRSDGAGQKAVLRAGPGGHFVSSGSINGGAVRFIVDTGASLISIGAADAARLGIDPGRGRPGMAQTANGVTPVSLVRLDEVRIGDIVLKNIDAVVHGQNLPYVLLGNSFLNRTEMLREGDQMILKRRD